MLIKNLYLKPVNAYTNFFHVVGFAGSESQDAVEMEPLRQDVETPNGSLGSRRYIGTGPPSNTTEDTMLTVNTASQPSSRVEGSLITPGQLSVTDSSSQPHYTNGSIPPHPNIQVDSGTSSSNTYPSGDSSLTGLKQVSEPTVHMPEKKDVAPTVDETSPKLTGAQNGGADLGADTDNQTVRKLPVNNESSPKRLNRVAVYPRPALRLNTDSTDKKKPVGVVSRECKLACATQFITFVEIIHKSMRNKGISY